MQPIGDQESKHMSLWEFFIFNSQNKVYCSSELLQAVVACVYPLFKHRWSLARDRLYPHRPAASLQNPIAGDTVLLSSLISSPFFRGSRAPGKGVSKLIVIKVNILSYEDNTPSAFLGIFSVTVSIAVVATMVYSMCPSWQCVWGCLVLHVMFTACPRAVWTLALFFCFKVITTIVCWDAGNAGRWGCRWGVRQLELPHWEDWMLPHLTIWKRQTSIARMCPVGKKVLENLHSETGREGGCWPSWETAWCFS